MLEEIKSASTQYYDGLLTRREYQQRLLRALGGYDWDLAGEKNPLRTEIMELATLLKEILY